MVIRGVCVGELAVLLCASATPLRAAPLTDLYEITSGRFDVYSGWGQFDGSLPASWLDSMELTADAQTDLANLRLLGDQQQPQDFWGWEYTDPVFEGNRTGNVIRFDGALVDDYDFSHALYQYTVVLDGNSLRLDGQLTIDAPCLDCDTTLDFSAVTAVLVPEPTSATFILAAFLSFGARRSRGWRVTRAYRNVAR